MLISMKPDDSSAALLEWPSAEVLQCNCRTHITVPEIVDNCANPILRERVRRGRFRANSLVKVERDTGTYEVFEEPFRPIVSVDRDRLGSRTDRTNRPTQDMHHFLSSCCKGGWQK